MKKLTITSTAALDSAVADCVRLKIKHTNRLADRDHALASVEKNHEAGIQSSAADIADAEAAIRDYCDANRAGLFAEKKSRETGLAVFGFEMTPPRVETAHRKIKWADVLERLRRAKWGLAYIRTRESLDKEALLADRDKLTPEQVTAAGVQFVQDEQFFLRPKPETAADSEAA
jgi:phage host-nuclease inhibitor protein Gam